MITRFLNAFGSYVAIAICLTLIVWSYAEKGFYDNYVSGEVFLIWTVYVFPWVIIAVNIAWQFNLLDRWFGR
jgi:hypothetical protein